MLVVDALGHRYPGAATAALDGVSLQLDRGSILGLLGPNGAGKTTLISHLTGALAAQRGEVRVDGEPLAALRRRAPGRIALAPQELGVYPMLTTAENLAVFAAAAGLPRARRRGRIEACIAVGRLEGFLKTRAGHLSGGLKRRLNLAIALLAEPQLLLLDEPTVGVDPQSRAFLLDTVRALARSGIAVVYASHYMEEIEAVADRVVILDHGRVLRSGTLAALLAEATPVLRLDLADADASVNAAALLARFGQAERAATGWRLALRPGVRPATVLAALDDAGLAVHHAAFGRHDLEQVFLSLTQRALRDHAP